MLPPNVLVVVMDDVGVDQVSAYGFEDAPPTPTLDGLARRGLRFDQAWAMPTCSPTRAALMTGRLPEVNRVGAVIHAVTPVELPLSEITIAEVLKGSERDWSTAAIGKWHLSTMISPSGVRHAKKQGFDLFAGSMNNIGAVPSMAPATDRAYDLWERVGFDGDVAISTTFATTAVVDDALEALERMEEPWFLYVAFQAAHRPLMPPPGTNVDPTDENALFAANVTYMDQQIGRLLHAVDLDDTFVVVVGDNGTPSYAKDASGQEGEKGSLNEGGVRVPFIAAGATVKARGSTDALASVTDLLPTIADLADARLPRAKLDGVSLVPVLRDADERVRDTVRAEIRHPPAGPPWRREMLAIRDERYKVRIEEDGTVVVSRVRGFGEVEVDPDSLDKDARKRVRRLQRTLENAR